MRHVAMPLPLLLLVTLSLDPASAAGHAARQPIARAPFAQPRLSSLSTHRRRLAREHTAASLQSPADVPHGHARPLNGTHGRAPSCGGCSRRESALSKTLHLHAFATLFRQVGLVPIILLGVALVVGLMFCAKSCLSWELFVTLFYALLYFIASPTAILVNKWIMKDFGFGYPIMVAGFGQVFTAAISQLAVRAGFETLDNGPKIPTRSMVMVGFFSALALVLGQYPYLYLTVAFIQMLKAFSPAIMVFFLSCLAVEYPSRQVIATVFGLSLCTAVASAGEVNFNLLGFLLMMGASASDALRLVFTQKLLKNQKLKPVEMLYYTAPACLLWMLPAAAALELPTFFRHHSVAIMRRHPLMFVASGCSGLWVNVTASLLVKRTSSMTLKTMTMTRNGGLVMVSAALMGETITGLETVGYSGLLFFFAMYTVTKAKEAAR